MKEGTTMRTWTSETIIVNQTAWKFLKNWDRTRRDYTALSDEALDKSWNRDEFKNGGASRKTHPIADNEIRIDGGSFAARLEVVKAILIENGFEFRQDGFVEEGIYL